MPYVSQGLRKQLEPTLAPLCLLIRGSRHAGTLNYIVTRLALAWLGDKPRYEGYNAAIGALECAKLELYRKHLAYHEDAAMVKNGPLPSA